jgi:hypothetical protein
MNTNPSLDCNKCVEENECNKALQKTFPRLRPRLTKTTVVGLQLK